MRRPPAYRQPGGNAPAVGIPPSPFERGLSQRKVACRWCVPCEQVLGGGHAGLRALGTRVSRLAMKWVRQRCQPAPEWYPPSSSPRQSQIAHSFRVSASAAAPPTRLTEAGPLATRTPRGLCSLGPAGGPGAPAHPPRRRRGPGPGPGRRSDLPASRRSRRRGPWPR